MGRCSRHFGRDIDGIILLDKPLGLSSNDLLQKVKKLFCANKAGHTGALDPLATGMLPICFGEATKFSQHLLNADKRYRVIARLGERTNTADAYGEIVSIRPVVLDEIRLAETLNTFRGITLQVPSMFSALKHQGRSLYEYARQGINVVRKARPIQIYNLQLLHWESTKVDLEIHCSKGTYIRTLIDDLGERLGCGAHVQLLRRLTVGSYPSTCMVTLDSLQTIAVDTPETFIQLDKMLLPIDSALKDMPIVNLPLEIATRVQFGQAVVFSEFPKNGFVRLSEKETGRFFGIGEITALKRLMPRRLITKPRP